MKLGVIVGAVVEVLVGVVVVDVVVVVVVVIIFCIENGLSETSSSELPSEQVATTLIK